MMCWQKNAIRTFILTIVAVFLLAGFSAAIDEHVVNPPELHKAMLAASQARQDNLASVNKFFTSEPVANALRSTRMDPVKIERAVALLDDQELSRLAARTAKVQEELAAGSLTNQQLTYIVIALATAVIIIIIVVA